MRKLISSCLIFALFLLTLTSCGDDNWIVKYGSHKVSPDVYSYYVYSTYEMLEYYNRIDSLNPLNEQLVKDTDENGEVVEIPADEYITDYAIDEILFLCELKKRFKGAGLKLSENSLSSIETSANTEYNSYEGIFKDNGITVDTVKKASNSGELGAMRQQLFEFLYCKGGPKEVTEEQMEAYYKERYVSYSYIYRTLVDSDGVILEDEGKAAIMAELEGIKSKIQSGEADIDTYAKEYAQAYADDKSCGKNGVASTTSQKSNTTLMEVLSQMKDGEIRLVELNNYAFLLKKNDIMSTGYYDNPDNRYNILVTMKFDEFVKEITDASKKSDYKINEKALKSFGIDKFDFQKSGGK